MSAAKYKWAVVDDIMIGIGTTGNMQSDIWSAFVKEMAESKVTKYLSINYGDVNVDSVQRRDAIDVVKAKSIRVAAVSDSRVVRGIITAASWFGVDIKSFNENQINEAVQFLGCPPNRVSAVVNKCKEITAQLMPRANT